MAHLKAFSPQGQETILALDGRLECDESDPNAALSLLQTLTALGELTEEERLERLVPSQHCQWLR